MMFGTASTILVLLARFAFPVTVAATPSTPTVDDNSDYYDDTTDYYDYGSPCDYIDDTEIHPAYEGEEVLLRCPLADCISPSSRFSWSKDGKPYPWTDPPTERIHMRGDLHQQLEIDNAQIAPDSGTYRCEGLNGTELLVGRILLDIKLAPTTQSPVFLHPMKTQYWGQLGQEVNFTCEAYMGVQQPVTQVYWLVNNNITEALSNDTIKEPPPVEWTDEQGRIFVSRTLTIISIRPEDYRSNFTCFAKNVYGNITSQAVLREGNGPNAGSSSGEHMTNVMRQYRNGAAGGGAVLLLLCVLAFVYYRKKLEIQLIIKDKFMPFEEGDTIRHTSVGDDDYHFHEQELHVTHFTVDVKLQRNARVLLSSEKGLKGVRYEIIIGSDNNTRSTVRRQTIRDTGVSEQREVSTVTPQILSRDEWKTFWISFKDNNIEVGIPGEDPFLKWAEGGPLNIKYLGYMNGSGEKGKLLFSDLGQKEYDVFILYDVGQIGFVKDLLLPFLEKTCRCVVRIEHRDFAGGSILVDEYVEFIKRSRRVLFVLSPDYVKNQWMKFASCVALDEMLRERARIVMIEYQPIKDQGDLETLKIFNEQVRKLMKAVTCIKWSEEAEKRVDHRFWRELRYNMPKKRVLGRQCSAWDLLRQRSVAADSVVSSSIVSFGPRRQRSTLSDSVALSDDSAMILEDEREEVNVTTPCLAFIDETQASNKRDSRLEMETVL